MPSSTEAEGTKNGRPAGRVWSCWPGHMSLTATLFSFGSTWRRRVQLGLPPRRVVRWGRGRDDLLAGAHVARMPGEFLRCRRNHAGGVHLLRQARHRIADTALRGARDHRRAVRPGVMEHRPGGGDAPGGRRRSPEPLVGPDQPPRRPHHGPYRPGHARFAASSGTGIRQQHQHLLPDADRVGRPDLPHHVLPHVHLGDTAAHHEARRPAPIQDPRRDPGTHAGCRCRGGRRALNLLPRVHPGGPPAGVGNHRLYRGYGVRDDRRRRHAVPSAPGPIPQRRRPRGPESAGPGTFGGV